MTAMQSISNKDSQPASLAFPLPLERLYAWEKSAGKKLFMSQPMGAGKIESFTWKRVADEVRRMATYLRSLNLPENSHIALMSKNCAHWIMTDLAIWMAGHISVPLYPTLTADTVQQIMEHSGAKVLFVGKLDGWDEMKKGVPEGTHCISYPLSPPNDYPTWNDIIKDNKPFEEMPTRTAEELATIIYTSGTTGAPKGVMHSFGSMAAAAGNAATIYDMGSKDRVLSYLPLSHVAERVCVELLALYQGFTVYFADSLETFAADLKRANPTIFFAVPRIWTKFQMGIFEKMPEKKLSLMLKLPIVSGLIKKKVLKGLGLDAAKFCISGAAPIPSSLIHWYKTLGIELLEGYGMTENLAYSHMSRKGKVRAGYVGQNNPGVVTRISEEGEILVSSPCTMMGYYKDEEKTKEVLTEDRFLRTGDKGEIDKQGRLKITGRIKDLFKTSKGKYVAPSPIEGKFAANCHIEQVCVVGANLPQPLVLVTLSEAANALAESGDKESLSEEFAQLRNEVNNQIDAHERLKVLVVVKGDWTLENGIMTPTLKIKRNVLEERYAERIEQWASSKQPVIWETDA